MFGIDFGTCLLTRACDADEFGKKSDTVLVSTMSVFAHDTGLPCGACVRAQQLYDACGGDLRMCTTQWIVPRLGYTSMQHSAGKNVSCVHRIGSGDVVLYWRSHVGANSRYLSYSLVQYRKDSAGVEYFETTHRGSVYSMSGLATMIADLDRRLGRTRGNDGFLADLN